MNPEWRLWLSQIAAILRLEIRKSFFSRRGAIIYLLAGMPVFLFAAHSAIQIYRGKPCDLGEDTHILAMVFYFAQRLANRAPLG